MLRGNRGSPLAEELVELVFEKQIKVCSTLPGHSKGKKTRDKKRRICDKTCLNSVQPPTQRYRGSCKQCVEIAHPGASKFIVNIGKGIRAVGDAFKCLSYLMLSPLS